MCIRNEPGAVREPTTDVPLELVRIEHRGLWNDGRLARIDHLDVNAFPICIGEVFSVGRNRTILDRVFEGIRCELLLLELVPARSKIPKPQDRTRNQQ